MFKKLNLQYLFSYSGLIPFFYLIIDKYFFFQIKEEIFIDFSIYYTLLILVFIGAINWSFQYKIREIIIIYGFVPSIFASFIIILNLYDFNSFYLFLVLQILLIFQLILDYFLIFSRKRNLNIYYFLRLPLTVIMIIFLGIIIS